MSELRQRRQKQQQQQQQQNNNNNHHSGTGGGGGGAAATSVAAATTQTTDIDPNKRTTTTAVRDTATAFSTTTTTSSSRKSRNPNSNNSNNNNSQPPTKTNHTTALAASTTKKKGRFLTLSSLASSSAAASTTATTTTSSTRGLLGGSKKMPTTTTQSLLSLSLSSPPTAPTTTRRQSSSTTDLAQAAAALAAKPPPPPPPMVPLPQPLLLHRESSSFVMAPNSTQLSHSESSQSFWGNAAPQQQQQQPQQQLLLPAQPQPIPIIMTTPDQVRKKELTLRRFLLRLSIGSVLFSSFCGIVYLGHLYICLLVVLIETVLFYELVRVRYFAFYPHIKDNTIPLFRTTQWMWFFTAMIYTYGDFLSDIVQHNHEEWHQVVPYLPYFGSISLVLYSATLMVTIVTLQRDHLKFQINQLCWTVVVLCLTLGQLKYVMHNIFNGLIWFVMPVCMVIFNDVMAYACGITMGRKFITRPFLSFSPNKTWEGFVGAGVCTLVASWYFGQFLVQFSWLTCPTKEFRIVPQSLHCTPDPVFMPAQWVFPSQMFELLPQNLARTIPGMVEICSSSSTTFVNVAPSHMGVTMEHDGMMPPPKQHDQVLEPCISGNDRQVHHHFELRIKDNFYPIQLHAVWLALFASVVAPFGGFLASAIKRAYGLKDFAAIIPGHGGMMDRMDCQFFMALCTWVYYNSFIKIATVSVPKLTYLYSLLSEPEQGELIQWIVENSPHVAAKAVAAAAAAAAGTASSSGAESSGAEPPLSLDDRNNYYDDDTEVIWLDDKTTNGF